MAGIAAGVSAALVWRKAPVDAAGWALLLAWHIVVVAGVVLSVIDVAVYRLPTPVVAGTAACVVPAIAAVAVFAGDVQVLVNAVLGALMLGCGYLLVLVVSRGGIGAGDVRLAVIIGWVSGATSWRTVVACALAPHLLAAPFASWIAVRAHRRGERPAPFAFGPFLVAGAVLAVLLYPLSPR